MSSNLDAALAYAARGWPVFPCHAIRGGRCTCGPRGCASPAKHPRTARGFQDATTDTEQIRQWWRKWPDANIGIPTGQVSGIVVLDVDIDKQSGEPIGERTFADLEERWGTVPDSVEGITGGGGRHIVARYPDIPEGHKMRSSQGDQGNGLGPGLDVRADGGYVIAPPSGHKSGRQYEWEGSSHPDDVPLADLPAAWVAAMVEEPAAPQDPETAVDPVRALPLGKKALKFIAFGTPVGSQRAAALAATRNLLSSGHTPAETTSLVWRGLQAGGSDPARGPWTRDDAEAIVADLARTPGLPPEPTRAEFRRQAHNAKIADLPGAPSMNGAGPSPDYPWPSFAHRLTDMANGQRLARQHGQNWRSCPYLSWPSLVWDAHRWRPDDVGTVERWAKTTALSIYAEAENIEADDNNDDEDAEAAKLSAGITKWAKTSQAASRQAAMISLARTEPGIPVRPEQLDQYPMLFNAANVTINLETGAVRGQRHEDLLTKISPVRYEPGATCPKWLAFLDRIFASDHSLSDFIQRAVGYSLTGLTVEQVFFIMYGTGANGKTVFLSILTALFGEYAQWTEFSTFLMRDKDSIRNDLAALKGARLVSAAESSQGRRLDETVIKQVTGGDAIRARFLHKEFFEYSPEFTVWLATNHKPEVRGNDHALWRRIRLLPFTVTISNDEQDRGLTRKLLEELPGILNWALDGLASWRDSGLGYPDVVREATELYRDDMDFLRDFLSEVTIVEPQAYTLHRDLFLAYKQWSDDNSERPVGAKRFTQLLVERNYERGKFGTSSARGFGGLVLRGGWPRTEI